MFAQETPADRECSVRFDSAILKTHRKPPSRFPEGVHFANREGAAGSEFHQHICLLAEPLFLSVSNIINTSRMPLLPSNTGPTPPAILRACARLTRLDVADGMALADELMVSNPDFFCHGLALASIGVARAKVDAALRVAFFLEVCHREQKGRPLPLFAPEVVDRHRKKTLQTFSRISDVSAEKPDRAAKMLLSNQAQIHVTSWIFKLLTDAGVIAMHSEDDLKVVICAFTLLSLYSSVFPPVPSAG